MSKLIPFSSRKSDLANAGFGGFYSMLDDFFTDDFPFKRSLANDSFKLDIQEKEDAYIIEAELPGGGAKDLDGLAGDFGAGPVAGNQSDGIGLFHKGGH